MKDRVFFKLQEIIIDKLMVDSDEVKPDSFFYDDLGADSLDQLDIMVSAERTFNIAVPEEIYDEIQTVENMVQAIEDQLNKKSHDV